MVRQHARLVQTHRVEVNLHHLQHCVGCLVWLAFDIGQPAQLAFVFFVEFFQSGPVTALKCGPPERREVIDALLLHGDHLSLWQNAAVCLKRVGKKRCLLVFIARNRLTEQNLTQLEVCFVYKRQVCLGCDDLAQHVGGLFIERHRGGTVCSFTLIDFDARLRGKCECKQVFAA